MKMPMNGESEVFEDGKILLEERGDDGANACKLLCTHRCTKGAGYFCFHLDHPNIAFCL
ncbi:hypothetical protein FHR92_003634, partial [Fontibacillus solani]|nr:hypothetical protein [Fontibacillus solani]